MSTYSHVCFPFPPQEAGGGVRLLLLGQLEGSGEPGHRDLAKQRLRHQQHPDTRELPDPCFTRLVFIYPALLKPPSSKFPPRSLPLTHLPLPAPSFNPSHNFWFCPLSPHPAFSCPPSYLSSLRSVLDSFSSLYFS